MLGVSGSGVVIDELIDFVGARTDKGALKKLILQFAPNKKMLRLSPHVFDVLSDKCTQLERFELRGTDMIKEAKPREVLQNFF